MIVLLKQPIAVLVLLVIFHLDFLDILQIGENGLVGLHFIDYDGLVRIAHLLLLGAYYLVCTFFIGFLSLT